MRVLHILAGAEVGGAETFARETIAGLAARGVAQHVVGRDYPAVRAMVGRAGVPLTALRFSWLDRAMGAPGRIRRLARGFGADVVHAWMSRAAAFVPAGMPCPVIGWFGDHYDLRYFRHADASIGVTPDIVRWTLRHGIAPHRAFLVNTFGTMPDSQPVRRADLGVPPDATMLLVLSRMHRVKGIDTILEALPDVPDVFLCIAGDGPARAEYETLAQRLGLGSRVRFLGWRNDRRALLDACDICVLPSRYEPFGTVILEAWAAGRPLVATRADGARQYVEDGVNGLLCPIDDPAALAACLRRVSRDEPALRDRLAAAGLARYRQDFTQDRVLDRLLSVYETVRVLGPRGRDDVRPAVPDAALRDAIAACLPPEARGRAEAVARVAAAYAGADRATLAAAAAIQASGGGDWGRGGRVLVAPAPQVARAAGELPLSADIAPYAALAAWLGQPGSAPLT